MSRPQKPRRDTRKEEIGKAQGKASVTARAMIVFEWIKHARNNVLILEL